MAAVRAKIRMEVEIDVGTWDGKATFDTLRGQVAKEGLTIARRMFDENRLDAKIVGEPQVVTVMVVDEQ